MVNVVDLLLAVDSFLPSIDARRSHYAPTPTFLHAHTACMPTPQSLHHSPFWPLSRLDSVD